MDEKPPIIQYVKAEEASLKKTFQAFFSFLLRNHLFLIWFGILFLTCFLVSSISPAPVQTHFVDLAASFLKGHTYVVDTSRLFDDIATYNKHTYVFYNPFPAILLMPFVLLFGSSFHQEYLTPFLTIINLILLYRIARKVGVRTEEESLWIALGMIFGSVYLLLSLTTISAYFVQVVGFTCLLGAVHEFLYKRWLLVGLLVGCAGATRATLFLGSIFFILELLRERLPLKNKLTLLFLLLFPIVYIAFLLGCYNYARFGKFTETGYNYQTSSNQIYNMSRVPGIFSPVHIPGNLYFFLFKGPDVIRSDDVTYILKPPYFRVSEWGLGLFFTSPIFLYLLLVRKHEPYVLSAGITVLAMLIPITTYFVSGIWQYGYRYGLDFYPFLFLLLFPVFRQGIPILGKVLITCSIIFTLLYMYSIWDRYPLLMLWHMIP
jgi:hypothetical protein